MNNVRQNRPVQKELIIDGETLVILWQDVIRYFKDTRIFISGANYLGAQKFYTEYVEMLGRECGEKRVEEFLKDTRVLREVLLFHPTINTIFNRFLTTSNPYTSSMWANSAQNLQFVFYKGFTIDTSSIGMDADFKFAPWLEEVVAHSFFRKINNQPIDIFTCSDLLVDLVHTSQLGLPMFPVDLDKLCD